MGYIPFNYEQINYAAGTHLPNTVKAYNNQTFAFWQRALFQRACSTLIITMPEEWKKNKDLLYWCLFRIGFVCCGKDNGFTGAFSGSALYAAEKITISASVNGSIRAACPDSISITGRRKPLSAIPTLKTGKECRHRWI